MDWPVQIHSSFDGHDLDSTSKACLCDLGVQMGNRKALNRHRLPPDQPPDLAQIYDTIPIGLAFLSPDCRYLQINQRMTEICGIPVADHLGRSVRETLPRLAEQVESIVQSVIATGEPITGIEVSGERPDETGTDRFWTTSWQPLKAGDGTIIGVNVAAEEITHRKRTQAALAFANISRQTTMDAMTASIAHEINQPLAAVVTNATAGLRWLAHSPPNLDEAKMCLERVVNDGHRASAIVASVRGLFGKNTSERVRVDPNEIIREVLSHVHGDITNGNVALQTALAKKLPQVLADRIQLQQVLSNLVLNALEAMSEVADRERTLIVKSDRQEPDAVLLTLEDTGPGIDPAYLDRIFDPFFTTKAKGMGMGLAICRSIIKTHGGDLWASSKASAGTILHLTLPIA
ncbi:PAS domain-containing protein [Nordella sp. HKS 07]|uniref:ATP-binding protein n=1 Tax=Nordella sp. HKS 07 TaxID=2712222 RepID=UPI0013E1E1F2|nr:ATP-binding protein [Nordella sp. HKS 07]QIG48313.1 PAS domain-containing protein [Nordella sp. HKS 07]